VSDAAPTTYRQVVKGIPTELRLDRALYRACQDVTAIISESPMKFPGEIVRGALEAEAVDRVGDQ
jgi:hypothetical protein